MAANPSENYRERLGTRLVFTCTIALVVLGAFVMTGAIVAELRGAGPNVIRDTAQLLFSSLLPLLGTWVGTILAFYYSRENYEAATRGTIDVVQSIMQRLSSTPVMDSMMRRSAMITLDIPADQTIADPTLADVAAKFQNIGANGQRISRLPIIDSKGVCLAFLHRGVWAEMLSSALVANGALDMKATKLGTILKAPYPLRSGILYSDFIRGAVAFVAQSANLADAKATMEQVSGCQDVVVTAGGRPTEPTLGWISNIDISRLSKA